MKNTIKTVLVLLGLLVLSQGSVEAADQSALLRGHSVELAEEADFRQLRLHWFLKDKQSPLLGSADDFLVSADNWQIDWRLLPAIAGLESGYGHHLVSGSFNAYGWGGGYIYFDNWTESIDLVSKGLKQKYYDRGLSTPETIGRVYAPPNPRWGQLISSIMRSI
ncbi:MAG: hypothetical protein ABID04_04055 [Patescibacteria group bacterium]